jgi:hypothetical protein
VEAFWGLGLYRAWMTETPEDPPAKTPTAWWVYALVIVVVALCGLFIFRSNHTTATPEDLSRDAQRACEKDFLPGKLKAPASAKFSGESVANDGDTYTVTGQVDSQNSFGATIRAPFTCVMKSDGNQWDLDFATVSG